MKINCLIIDDEALARKGLQEYVSALDFLELKGLCKNAIQANTLLKAEDIHLIFLDIEMPLISGMDFLKSLQNPPKVIFTTAYTEYAVESFEYDVVDYLVKPISMERFLQACNKAHKVILGDQKEGIADTKPADEDDFLFVRIDKELVKIKFDDILFVEGMQNYVKIFTKEQTYIAHLPLKNVMECLPKESFFQVHKSFISSLDKVEVISGNQLIIQNHKIPIGRTKKEAVLALLTKNRLLKK
ncbi:LytTR family DNA-binding domain-containing protein [Allomuricauda sp. SCSIO 65647]|uniref:LytR/AlgR family response regulator transcription factor n=1 Tax=Allomuricauda sp. SCSIO 65647 TaxID=2908843 RepID=UPI001F18ECED|nr:LytTR family DNA-binding domain-containing protein [Muricauda sp. SCSIO 65647]UJH69191.1 LytTR family DNA-binding domain-containing protein [Muricauda sp. SCSIO 65647]